VLIASDDRLFRECLADRLRREKRFTLLGTVSGSDLRQRVRSSRPQLVLFDSDGLGPMPGGLLLETKRSMPGVRILAITAVADDRAVADGLRHGAGGVIGRTESAAELVRAMAAVASGETWAGRKAIARALQWVAENRRSSMTLTPRERQLLSLLAGGYRNKELASMIRVKEQTVKIHLHNLFRKLNVRTRVEAVLKAAGQH
jgi:two-component system nitrate/nitrite response regulator NarL